MTGLVRCAAIGLAALGMCACAFGGDSKTVDRPLAIHLNPITGTHGKSFFFSSSDANGVPVLVMDSVEGEKSVLYSVRLPSTRTADPAALIAEPIDVGEFAFAASPSLVRIGGSDWLYFIGRRPKFQRLAMYRVAWPVRKGEQARKIEVADDLSPYSWPRIVALDSSGAVMAFRDSLYTARASFTANGLHFDKGEEISSAAAMPSFGEFGSGTLAFSYQRGHRSNMRSYLRLLQPGERHWGPEIEIFPQSGNVHDAYLHREIDGRLSVYFISPDDEGLRFKVFRRCVDPEGRLGRPETILDLDGRSFAKPHVFTAGDVQWIVASDLSDGSRPWLGPLSPGRHCGAEQTLLSTTRPRFPAGAIHAP